MLQQDYLPNVPSRPPCSTALRPLNQPNRGLLHVMGVGRVDRDHKEKPYLSTSKDVYLVGLRESVILFCNNLRSGKKKKKKSVDFARENAFESLWHPPRTRVRAFWWGSVPPGSPNADRDIFPYPFLSSYCPQYPKKKGYVNFKICSPNCKISLAFLSYRQFMVLQNPVFEFVCDGPSSRQWLALKFRFIHF